MVMPRERSNVKITKTDLRRLLAIATEDLHDFFQRQRHYQKYEKKVRLIALCQGAALHYIDGTNGIKDFDVWAFYPGLDPALPYRRRGYIDFGASKFGRRRNSKTEGRTVDVLFRSDTSFNTKDPRRGITRYLEGAKTPSSRHLGRKAVVGLYPESVFGQVLWDGS